MCLKILGKNDDKYLTRFNFYKIAVEEQIRPSVFTSQCS